MRSPGNNQWPGRFRLGLLMLVGGLVAAGCGGSASSGSTTGAPLATTTSTVAATTTAAIADTTPQPGGDGLFPDVVAVEVARMSSGLLRFDVTMTSPYDTAERYADAWRVLGADDTVYGVRELTHDHGNEQPFTRSLDGVDIPEGVVEVTIQGRDILNGWGGATIDVAVPPEDE